MRIKDIEVGQTYAVLLFGINVKAVVTEKLNDGKLKLGLRPFQGKTAVVSSRKVLRIWTAEDETLLNIKDDYKQRCKRLIERAERKSIVARCNYSPSRPQVTIDMTVFERLLGYLEEED